MELSRNRHLFYFSEQPIPVVEDLFYLKQIAFTHIDSSDPDGALQEALRLTQAFLGHPDHQPDGVGLICFGSACTLALSLQELISTRLLLVNPERQEFFNNPCIIEADDPESMVLQIKERLENNI